MEFKEEEHILNARLIIDHFGYWPTFHDAEVLSINFQRDLKKVVPAWNFGCMLSK